MQLEQIGIVSLAVADWEAAVDWYTGKLDLQVVERDDAGGWCRLAFAGGGATLALMRVPGLDTSVRSRCSPLIRVDDLDGTLAELGAGGVAVNQHVHEGREYRIGSCSDLEGNRLQIYQLRDA